MLREIFGFDPQRGVALDFVVQAGLGKSVFRTVVCGKQSARLKNPGRNPVYRLVPWEAASQTLIPNIVFAVRD